MTMPVSTDIAAARLTVDLAALVRNYRRIVALAPAAAVAGVVKANGYGLGAAEVAAALAAAGCRHFFVAHLSEVAAVQRSVPEDTAIYVLNGLVAGTEHACRDIGAIPVLNSLPQLARWRAAADGAPAPAILQVDTGMARLGLSAEEVAQLVADPALLDGVALRFVMSHLACGDERDAASNAEQLARFRAITDALPAAPRSLANSGGAFLGGDYHFDLLRPGIALYGGSPQTGVAMEPVAYLSASIVQTRCVPAGAGIGYGLTAPAPRPRTIATIGVGYADGWPRRLGNRGSVFVGDTRVPIVGRVSMDSILIDVSDVPDERRQPGCMVELLGPQQRVDDVAGDADTIAYEILTQLGARYDRRYIGPDAPGSDRA